MKLNVQKIVSGGQTGADRAALDTALAVGLACGGWCPAGRWAEDGPLPDRYPLTEAPSRDPAVRTAWNVRDSDATLVLTLGWTDEGTRLTIAEARGRGKPLRVSDLTEPAEEVLVRRWLREQGVRVLNVAGPRESRAPGLYVAARAFLLRLFPQEPDTGQG